jgi:hypothetical protein
MIRLLLAAGLLLARLLIPRWPVEAGGQQLSLSQAHGLCSSGLGQLAQMVSHPAAIGCGRVAAAYDALNILVLVAALLVVWWAASLTGRARPASPGRQPR